MPKEKWSLKKTGDKLQSTNPSVNIPISATQTLAGVWAGHWVEKVFFFEQKYQVIETRTAPATSYKFWRVHV